MGKLDYDEIDANIAPLVSVLNSFQGVSTVGSCGGHKEPLSGGQWAEGTWYIRLEFADSAHGKFALEFLAWVINHDGRKAGSQVHLFPDALPPYLNEPGKMLSYLIEGHGDDEPVKKAAHLNAAKENFYVSPEELEDTA